MNEETIDETVINNKRLKRIFNDNTFNNSSHVNHESSEQHHAHWVIHDDNMIIVHGQVEKGPKGDSQKVWVGATFSNKCITFALNDAFERIQLQYYFIDTRKQPRSVITHWYSTLSTLILCYFLSLYLRNTSFSNMESDTLQRRGTRICPAVLNSRSTAALLGSVVLY